MILIVLNPISGTGKSTKIYGDLKEYLRRNGVNHSIYETRSPRDWIGISDQIRNTQPELVVSCGGDGTAHDVLNALSAHTHIPVLILPAGSGNDFSTRLYGSLSADTLFPLVHSKNYAFADLGKCNGEIFVNGIGIGFDGAVSGDTQNTQRKWLPPMWKYYLAIARNILFYKEIELSIEQDEKSKTFMLAVANGPCYGGGFKIAPGAEINDGLLDMVHIHKVPSFLRPFYIPKVKNGQHLGLSFAKHRHIRSVLIRSSNDVVLPAHADGEFFENTVFEIAVIPQAMKYPIA